MTTRAAFGLVAACLLGAVVSVVNASAEKTAEQTEKLTFESAGAKRAYFLFVPEKAVPGPAPLLLLLHGSRRDGKSLVDPWVPLARSQGIVLVAPNASDPAAWRIPQDGPDFIRDLI